MRAIRHAFEKDVSDRCFYCFNCGKYHRYSKSWWFETNLSSAALPPCEDRVGLYRIGIWDFGFHHFQLVMNEHFYGAGRGLRQPRFRPKCAAAGSIWQFQPRLAILDDQCFLSVRYEVLLSGTPEENQQQLDGCWQWIRFCCHYEMRPRRRFAGRAYPRRLPELQVLWDAWGRGDSDPRKYSTTQGYCPICLTDYTFEMDRHPHRLAPGHEVYSIEVVTYQQVGACRTPDDWMWQALTTAWLEKYPGIITRQRYIDSEHKPGAVKRRWELGHALKEGNQNYQGDTGVASSGNGQLAS